MILPPVSAAERRDFNPEQKDGCLSAASFRPSRIKTPAEREPAAGGPTGGDLLLLTFLGRQEK